MRCLGMQAQHLLRSSGLPLQKRCGQRFAPYVLGMSSYRSIPAPGSKSEAQLESTCTDSACCTRTHLQHDMSSPAAMSGFSTWSSRRAGKQIAAVPEAILAASQSLAGQQAYAGTEPWPAGPGQNLMAGWPFRRLSRALSSASSAVSADALTLAHAQCSSTCIT